MRIGSFTGNCRRSTAARYKDTCRWSTVKSKCDFCGEKPVLWAYKVRPFELAIEGPERVAQFKSAGTWVTCGECHFLVETKNWEMMAVRALEHTPGWKLMYPEEALTLVNEFQRLYQAFRDNLYGDPPCSPIQ